MPRRVYLLGVGIALVALAFVVTDAALGPRLGVTQANAWHVRTGMTYEQVEAILGPTLFAFGSGNWLHAYWADEGGQATVCFACGRVTSVHFSREGRFPRIRPSPLGRLRAWLGW
jgi:hypothetical protein